MEREHKVQLSIKRGNDMLNVRADNANEFHALVEELSGLPELSAYFPRTATSPETRDTVEGAGGSVDETTRTAVTASPAPSTNGKKSALELARERMKGAA